MRVANAGTKRRPRAATKLLPVVGIDIGQKRDPTAIAVAEIEYRLPTAAPEGGRPRKESHYLVRHLERLALGTPYPEVARRLGEICNRVEHRCGRRPDVFVDATGVGQPIVDVLDAGSSRARVWSVYFTHGDRRIEYRSERKLTLGKAHLVSRFQALLQCQRIHLPTTAEARALAQELLDYEIRVDENANDRYGAFTVGTHDDLVTALGMAVNKEPTVSVYPGSVFYGL